MGLRNRGSVTSLRSYRTAAERVKNSTPANRRTAFDDSQSPAAWRCGTARARLALGSRTKEPLHSQGFNALHCDSDKPSVRRGAARIRTGDGGFAIHCLSHLATAPDPAIGREVLTVSAGTVGPVERIARNRRPVTSLSKIVAAARGTVKQTLPMAQAGTAATAHCKTSLPHNRRGDGENEGAITDPICTSDRSTLTMSVRSRCAVGGAANH